MGNDLRKGPLNVLNFYMWYAVDFAVFLHKYRPGRAFLCPRDQFRSVDKRYFTFFDVAQDRGAGNFQ